MIYYSALHYASKAEKSALSAATYAAQLKNATFGNIGDVKYSCRNVAPNGGVWCDGSEYTQAQFPDFYTMLVNGDIPSTTYENYTAELTANGVCGRFALDTANTKFRVPTLADAFFSSAVASNIGDYIGAKLAASSGTLTSGGVKYRPYVMLYVAAVEASTAQAAEFITALTGKENSSNKVSNMDTPSEETYLSTKGVNDCLLGHNRIARGIVNGSAKCTYSGMQITIPEGLLVNVPAGFKADGTLNYTTHATLANTFNIDTNVIGTSGEGVFFYNTDSNSGGSVLKSAYYDGYAQPTDVSAQYACWLDRTNNVYKFSADSGASWITVNVCFMGEFTISSSAVTSFTYYNNLSLVNESDLVLAENRIISIMNNRIQLVSSLPSSPESNVLYCIPE